MLHIDIAIEELDYDSLADALLPLLGEKLREGDSPAAVLFSGNLPAGMAKAMLHAMSRERKDRLAADLINRCSGELRVRAEAYAASQGVKIRLGDISVTT